MNNRAAINELSASEGIFTTAQAQRLGISRNALAHACKVGRLERVAQGAYRHAATPSSLTDELTALWKLTAPSAFSWERRANWDGIAIGGSTAAYLLDMGDFLLSPYRMYTPKRINSRISAASFATRPVAKEDIEWVNGLPVTCAERTIADLCLDREDPSLIADALRDAKRKNAFDPDRLNELRSLLQDNPRNRKAFAPLDYFALL